MRGARKTVEKFAAGATRATVKVGKFAAAMGAAAVVGTALLVRSQFKAIDVTSKLAARLGITTEKLGALFHAAEITGAGTEAMSKALGFLSKALGEAKQGIGEGKQAIEALGLSVDDFLGKTPDEQVRLIADAFQGLATQEEKAFIASKLFGRGGLPIINLLDQGRAGIDALEKDFIRLGGGFSALQGKMVEDANDAMTRLKLAFRVGAEGLAIAFAPFIGKGATFFTNLVADSSAWRNSLLGDIAGVARAFGLLANAPKIFRKELLLFRAAIAERLADVGGNLLDKLFPGRRGGTFSMDLVDPKTGERTRMTGGIASGSQPETPLLAQGLRDTAERLIASAGKLQDEIVNSITDLAKKFVDIARGDEVPELLRRPRETLAEFLGKSLLPSLTPALAAPGREVSFSTISRERTALGGRAGGGPVLTVLKSIETTGHELFEFFRSQNQFQFGERNFTGVTS